MIDPAVLSAFSSEMQKEALLGTLLTGPIRKALAKDALNKPKENKRLGELRKLIAKGDKTEIKIIDKEDLQGPRYENVKGPDGVGKQVVFVRENEHPAIIAHELGHSELDRETLGGILQSKPMRIASALGSAAGIIYARQSPTIGAVIAAASTLPILAYEGIASSRGVERLRRAGATEKELSDAKSRLLKAWGTYATMPVSHGVDAAFLGSLSRARR